MPTKSVMGTRTEIRMNPVHQPSSIAPPLLLQEPEGWLEPSIAAVAEARNHIEPDEDVVVVVARVVKAEPRNVLPLAVVKELPLQIELRASLD